jgi:3-dehydroquinate synthase
VSPTDPDLSVAVPLGARSYEVRVASGGPGGFGRFARKALESTWAGRACRRALIVTDENVSALVGPYADGLRGEGIAPEVAVLPPGEATKSLARAETLYGLLIAMRADRHTAVVAIGGGVIGDLAGSSRRPSPAACPCSWSRRRCSRRWTAPWAARSA